MTIMAKIGFVVFQIIDQTCLGMLNVYSSEWARTEHPPIIYQWNLIHYCKEDIKWYVIRH